MNGKRRMSKASSRLVTYKARPSLHRLPSLPEDGSPTGFMAERNTKTTNLTITISPPLSSRKGLPEHADVAAIPSDLKNLAIPPSEQLVSQNPKHVRSTVTRSRFVRPFSQSLRF